MRNFVASLVLYIFTAFFVLFPAVIDVSSMTVLLKNVIDSYALYSVSFMIILELFLIAWVCNSLNKLRFKKRYTFGFLLYVVGSALSNFPQNSGVILLSIFFVSVFCISFTYIMFATCSSVRRF